MGRGFHPCYRRHSRRVIAGTLGVLYLDAEFLGRWAEASILDTSSNACMPFKPANALSSAPASPPSSALRTYIHMYTHMCVCGRALLTWAPVWIAPCLRPFPLLLHRDGVLLFLPCSVPWSCDKDPRQSNITKGQADPCLKANKHGNIQPQSWSLSHNQCVRPWVILGAYYVC